MSWRHFKSCHKDKLTAVAWTTYCCNCAGCMIYLIKVSVRLFVHPSVRLFFSVCLSICSSIYLFIHVSFCLSVFLTVYLSVHPRVFLSVCLSNCLSVCLLIHLSFCLFICLSDCLFDCLCACVFICLSERLSISVFIISPFPCSIFRSKFCLYPWLQLERYSQFKPPTRPFWCTLLSRVPEKICPYSRQN